ncbi:cyclopropane-fatty-acyl-phospholipid synthase family protein [Streptacidiphilus sp. P02-A3a]|uniref:SAM-dependent methyltransferase n=1 Tax=Streptacidiphilus sp. P02-A3a TaxID=2704468 RepID=UPI0015F90769|nr:class I SAM-dependent methyltransferase [Streptacidiphilus sp. P02-A3a]QMU70540.1 methyltransferase domain-containing protein [Streptacidiphilus sp. P02-A3a]
MQNAEYLELVRTPGDREEHYARVVDRYYELVTDVCRDVWSDSFHLAWFAEGQRLPEAQLTLQRWLADQGRFSAGDRLLDVGCGIGGPAAAIAEHTGAEVTGVNICGHQVQVARSLHRDSEVGQRLTFVEADAMALPFGPAEFDGVFSIEALCYAPDRQHAYAQIAKVLRPGGGFVGVDWFCADGLSDADYARWVEPMCQGFAIPHVIPFGALKGLLQAAGFEVESVSRYSDHGDIGPNWQLHDANAAQAGGDRPDPAAGGFETLLAASMPALREGIEQGKVVMGCWVARKRADAAQDRPDRRGERA